MQLDFHKGLILIPAGMFLILEEAAAQGLGGGAGDDAARLLGIVKEAGVGIELVVPGIAGDAGGEALGGVKVRTSALGAGMLPPDAGADLAGEPARIE